MAAILLADDDAVLRDLVRRALEGDQHQVFAVQDGTEALEAIAASVPGLAVIITDVDMPGIDGIAVAARALAALPTVKVILMSGFAGQLERAGSLDASRLSSISKPFALDDIRQAVRKALV